MSLIADGLLVATCLTAALYCYVLSRRLKKLSNTEEGIGQQIRHFNEALDDTRNALKEIRTSAKGASEKLAREMAHSKKVAAELTRLIAKAESISQSGYPAEDPVPRSDASGDSHAEAGRETEPRAAQPASEADEPGTPTNDETSPAGAIDENEAEAGTADGIDDELGEQQLGFLPDIEDMAASDVEAQLGLDPSVSAPAEPEGKEDPANLPEDEEPDARHDEEIRGDTAPSKENLLQVERMAL